jgi:Na+-transporting NADH:ubiquinone oxidoreductase subunit F
MVSFLVTVGILSAIAAALAGVLVFAERFISNYGTCAIDVNNGTRVFSVQGGKALLGTLVEQKLFIPSACGGRGTCGYCKVKVLEGAGPLLPTEEPFLSAEERAAQVRLSCQVKVRNDIKIAIPEELLSVREFECTVARITQLTHDIREYRFTLNEPADITFIAGQYVQLLSPIYEKSSEEVYRAYSISSDPADTSAVELIIRLVPGGICTTYCFEYLKEGDKVRFNGPYGEFRMADTQAPMVMIAGGSGMAPIKCILHQMKNTGNTRAARYFFGANEVRELFELELMKEFEQALPKFTFTPVVRAPETAWQGETGLVTEAVARAYTDLSKHEAYLCGSPGMIDACIVVLTKLGMPQDKIYFDKFA